MAGKEAREKLIERVKETDGDVAKMSEIIDEFINEFYPIPALKQKLLEADLALVKANEQYAEAMTALGHSKQLEVKDQATYTYFFEWEESDVFFAWFEGLSLVWVHLKERDSHLREVLEKFEASPDYGIFLRTLVQRLLLKPDFFVYTQSIIEQFPKLLSDQIKVVVPDSYSIFLVKPLQLASINEQGQRTNAPAQASSHTAIETSLPLFQERVGIPSVWRSFEIADVSLESELMKKRLEFFPIPKPLVKSDGDGGEGDNEELLEWRDELWEDVTQMREAKRSPLDVAKQDIEKYAFFFIPLQTLLAQGFTTSFISELEEFSELTRYVFPKGFRFQESQIEEHKQYLIELLVARQQYFRLGSSVFTTQVIVPYGVERRYETEKTIISVMHSFEVPCTVNFDPTTTRLTTLLDTTNFCRNSTVRIKGRYRKKSTLAEASRFVHQALKDLSSNPGFADQDLL